MNTEFTLFFIVLSLLVLIDIPVITKVNPLMYQNQFQRTLKEGTNLTVNPVFSGSIAYLLIAFAIFWFVVKNQIGLETPDYKLLALNGALLGLSFMEHIT